MQYSAKKIAENASYQAFMNCFIREAGDVKWVKKEEWLKLNKQTYFLIGEEALELVLPYQQLRILLEVEYHSLVGRHSLGRIYMYHEGKKEWKEEEPLNCMISCIQELHLQAKENDRQEMASHYDELILLVIDSYHTMQTYITKSIEQNDINIKDYHFIQSEQSLLFGHWLHPTPKSRVGMATWQHDLYAPELRGFFQLHYFEVDPAIVITQYNKFGQSVTILDQLLEKSAENRYLYPMHPLQALWLLQQEHVQKAIHDGQIKYIGPRGKPFLPTSSIRTVYNEKEKWMYKFSIPVKVTNSLRVNKIHELKAGVVMSELFDSIDFLKRYPCFHVIDDPISLSLNIPVKEETGFEVIIRTNPFQKDKGKGIHSIAALVQDPLPDQESLLKKLVIDFSLTFQLTLEEASIEWFKKYWKCAVEPMFVLYDEYGLALEAHQQNSLVDVSNSFPTAFYFRDNQGYYLAESKRNKLEEIVGNLKNTSNLFYEEELIQERFTYYLFINHIFSLIHRMGTDDLIEESKLVSWMLEELKESEKRFSGEGKRFIVSLLSKNRLPCKANLLTRFHDVDELMTDLEQAVYTTLPNPLYDDGSRGIEGEEKHYAAASSV